MRREDSNWAASHDWPSWPGLMSGLVVGMQFRRDAAGRAWEWARSRYGEQPSFGVPLTCRLRREPENDHDGNAIAVDAQVGEQLLPLGYVPRRLALEWSTDFDMAGVRTLDLPGMLARQGRSFRLRLWPLRVVGVDPQPRDTLQLSLPVEQLSASWPPHQAE